VLWIPVIAVVQFTFQLGLSLMVAAITVFYRDIGNIISHLLRLLFYLAPILWSFDDLGAGRGGELKSALGEGGFQILHNNPVAILLEQYRHVVYGVVTDLPGGVGQTFLPAEPVALVQLFFMFIGSLVLCAFGALIFKRLEPAFAKVL